MKNKILIGVTALAIMSPFDIRAEILSSHNYTTSEIYDKCWEPYRNSTAQTVPQIVDACMDCFFLYDGVINTKKFRRKGEIRFNTNVGSCSDIEPDRYFYVDTYNQVPDWAASDFIDGAEWCLYGKSHEIAHLDEGEDQYTGIVFRFDDSGDEEHECYIEDASLISCAAGWYGFPYDDYDLLLYGCTKCPGNGTSDPKWGRSTSITDCYIPMNTKSSDLSGTYKYTDDCYYTK
ncbi:MAG: hypothetical protein NC311_01830 [Muribaculaceae bacterium]|nr:hypothetical protein [Muribaculaceae bacterium]